LDKLVLDTTGQARSREQRLRNEPDSERPAAEGQTGSRTVGEHSGSCVTQLAERTRKRPGQRHHQISVNAGRQHRHQHATMPFPHDWQQQPIQVTGNNSVR
jgi:hypothetical protein